MSDQPPTGVGRRAALGVALAALGAPAARADDLGALRGKVEGDQVLLPKLHGESEVEGPTTNTDPLARKLGVAVVGLGHLSLDEILPGTLTSKHVRVTALVSGSPAKARTVAAQYGVPDAALYDYAGFDRIKDNPAIDFVYIVLPNDMHAEYTVRAAQAGKHVLCEKPMATSIPDAERMIAACRDAGRKLMIAYRMQYDPYHRLLIKTVRDGQYGPLRAMSAVNGQNDAPDGQWRQVIRQAGGGALPDVGIYCFNAFRYITGREPLAVTAQLTQPRDDLRFREVEDSVSFTLRFPGDVLAQGLCGYSLHETRSLTVATAAASIHLDPAFAYQGLRMQIGHKVGAAAAVEERRFAHRSQFAREMDHLAECIRADRTPHTPGEEGLQDMRVMAAIYEAARGGGTVRMPEVPGLDTTRGPLPDEA